MFQSSLRACLICLASILPLMLSGQSAGVAKLEALSFQVPAGWDRVPSASHVSANIASRETYPFGSAQLRDTFTIRILPAHGGNLDSYADTVRQRLNGSVQHLVDFLKQKQGSGGGPKMDPKSARVEVKRTVIGKTPAYEFVSHTAQIQENNPLAFQSFTIVSLYKDRYYEITAGYANARVGKIKPAADAFLASLRFDAAR